MHILCIYCACWNIQRPHVHVFVTIYCFICLYSSQPTLLSRKVLWGTKKECTDRVYNADADLQSQWLQYLHTVDAIPMRFNVKYPSHLYEASFHWESLNDDVYYYSRAFSTVRRQKPLVESGSAKTNRVGFAVRNTQPGKTMHIICILYAFNMLSLLVLTVILLIGLTIGRLQKCRRTIVLWLHFRLCDSHRDGSAQNR